MTPYRTPPDGLLDTVMKRIERERRRAFRVRVALMGFLSVAAALALLPAWNFLAREALETGFAQFISLAFSDFAAVALYWKEFALSLLESLPAYGAVAVLSAFLVLGASVRSLVHTVTGSAALPMRLGRSGV